MMRIVCHSDKRQVLFADDLFFSFIALVRWDGVGANIPYVHMQCIVHTHKSKYTAGMGYYFGVGNRCTVAFRRMRAQVERYEKRLEFFLRVSFMNERWSLMFNTKWCKTEKKYDKITFCIESIIFLCGFWVVTISVCIQCTRLHEYRSKSHRSILVGSDFGF